MVKKYSIDETTDTLKKTLPILRSHLRSHALDGSTAVMEIDQVIADHRQSIETHYPRSIRDNFAQLADSMATWISRSAQAKPEERRVYEAGLEAIERRIEGFKVNAQVVMRDEERRNGVPA